jgi:hypothetical protein
MQLIKLVRPLVDETVARLIKERQDSRRVLIAISTCQQYELDGWNQQMRDTWLKKAVSLGMDYKFFIGMADRQLPGRDLAYIGHGDGWGDLTHKTKEKCRYAAMNGYSHVFMCFPDTYALPDRLLACGYEKYDYFGDLLGHANGEYCQGGCGYFLSAKACIYAMFHPTCYPNEDCWMGDIMRERPDMKKGDHKGFLQVPTVLPAPNNNIISCHLSCLEGGFGPRVMYDFHERVIKEFGR